MSLPSFAVRRPVMVTMIFLGITVIGLMSFIRLPLDMFPSVEPPMVTVITPWLGASATDIESKVTKPLEEALAVAPDLDELSSTSRDNFSVVQLKFSWSADLNEATNNIRTYISQIKPTMPEDVKDSLIFRLNLSQLPILMLAVTSDAARIEEQADLVNDYIANDLRRVDGVAAVTIFNERQKQLQVEVDRQRLEAYGLSLQQIAGALRANNLTLPAGTLDVGRNTYSVRAPGEFRNIEDVENVIVGQNGGALVYLKDLATVRVGLEDRAAAATFDGKPALLLMIQRESGANTVDVARAVQKRVAELDRSLPRGLHVATLMDLSDNIVMMIGSLTEAVWVAALLVIAIVVFFLRRWTSSLIVAISIPSSLVAAFALMQFGGFTLNIITLASMAIAIGLVVDDAIVVTDNIVRNMELGKSASEAAAIGASEVSGAVTAATLTNAAIFMPIVFVSGIVGIMFKELAFVIIATLLVSLLVALMLVPVLSQRLLTHKRKRREGRFWRFSERLFERAERAYGRIVVWALGNRKKVMAIALGTFVGSLAITMVIGVDFMPKIDGAMVTVTAELPVSTGLARSEEIGGRIEEIMRRQIPETRSVGIRAGAAREGVASLFGGRQGANIVTVTCNVPKRGQRDRSTFAMADAVREEVAAIPDIVTFEIDATNPLARVVTGGQRPITLDLYSPTGDLGELRRAAREIKRLVASTPGAIDVATDVIDDNPEIQLSIDRLAAARLGVPIAAVAAAVRASMYGSVETRYRGGSKDIDLFLRLREEDRSSVAALERLTVPSMTGEQILLSNIAKVVEAKSPMEVRRFNQQRTLSVMADVSGRPLGDVARDIESAIASEQAAGKIPPSITTRFGGDVKEQRNMVVDLSLALLLAVLLVYMVMAGQFESLLDPFVVMFSVPFGITGALLALPATGTTLSLTSFIGMIMTVGIVVKNAIVLVDYINLMRDKGMGLEEAIRVGGERRLRPVLMTALAILGGMLPLALSQGEGSEIWRPMAVAVIGGVAVSTLVTLVLIPSVYALTDRWRKRARQHTADADTEEIRAGQEGGGDGHAIRLVDRVRLARSAPTETRE